MDEAKPAHHERIVDLPYDERIMDVVSGEGQHRNREHHAPVEQADGILPDVNGVDRPDGEFRMPAILIQCGMHRLLLNSPWVVNIRVPEHR